MITMFIVRFLLVLSIIKLGNLASLEKDSIEIILLHTNDMHGRFLETNAQSNTCNKKDTKCYGGFARISSVVKQYRKKNKNVIFLNSGDTFTGTPAFSIFKDKIASEMMNLLKLDAGSLGNHDFDLGISGLVSYLSKLKFPVLAVNIDATHEPTIANFIKRSTIIEKNGLQIGVIGYITMETKQLSKANQLKYSPEIDGINQEAKSLKDKGVKVIIALGHSGLSEDLKIAKNCPDVDLVVGGHSHTFLYTGTELPDIEKPKDDYPVVVTQASGKKVPVVQAYAFTKYLGYLKLTFNVNGDLLKWEGQPILLDNKISEDSVILRALEKYLPKIEEYGSRVVGVTRVFLDGTSCRFQECNLGNLITDAFLHANVVSNRHSKKPWTDASIVLYSGGGIRTSIDVFSADGNITRSDLDNVLPFNGELHVVPVPGSTLHQALEHAVNRYSTKVGYGEFLQVSGLQIVYKLDWKSGSRIKSVKVKCNKCKIPRYQKLADKRIYNVIMSSFMKNGGDGFKMFKDLEILKTLPSKDIDMVEAYIKQMSPAYAAVEGRIILRGKVDE